MLSGRRFPGISVSGCRISSQSSVITENSMKAAKIARQPKPRMMKCPKVGAKAGTSAKTAITKDMIRAISRP